MTDAPDWVTLTQGEEVVLSAKPSKIPYLMTLTGELVLIVLGAGVLITGGVVTLFGTSISLTLSVLPIPLWVAVGVLLIGWGGLGVVRTALDWWSVHYVVTTEELYKKTGIFSRTVKNTRLETVQNTGFSQTWFGRFASYGDVQIDTAGSHGTELVFRHVNDPDGTIEKITRHLDRAKT